MFIQIIQGRTRDADRLHQALDEWRETLGRDVTGWLGGTYGITDEGEFVGVVRFESEKAARENSARPEQAEWWERTADCFDGEATFHDCDNAVEFLGGGSDDAGFVQIIQGRVSDPEGFRQMMSGDMDQMRDARPEILGGTLALEPDGWFTQTVAFRTEDEAREGEAREMPADVQERMAQMPEMADVRYLDLHQPWFASRWG